MESQSQSQSQSQDTQDYRVVTSRLILRPMSIEDKDDIFAIRSQREVMRWTRSGLNTNISQSNDWINSIVANPDAFNFSIELRQTPSDEPTGSEPNLGPASDSSMKNKVIGIVGAHAIPEIGYMISHNFWGHGYASEALAAFLPLYWAKVPSAKSTEGGYDFAEAYADPENAASVRVLEKCGFSLLERREKDIEIPLMGLRDSLLFRIARPGTCLPKAPADHIEVIPVS